MRRSFCVLALVALAGCVNAFIATDGRQFSSTAAESTKDKPLKQALIASGVKDLDCPERSVEVVSTEPPLAVDGCNKRATYTLAKSGQLTLDKVVDNTPSGPSSAHNGLQWQ